MHLPLLVFTLVVGSLKPVAAAPGWGAWIREHDARVEDLTKQPAAPAFLVMKAGIFDKRGRLRSVADPDRVNAFCRKGVEMHAWVTYRIGTTTTLTRAAGQALGGNLNKLLNRSCFASVELDIEPLNAPAPGMLEFLEEVRRVLRADRKLYFALPPVAPPTPKGLWWNEADLQALLKHVDGIDFMLYDTGLDVEEYRAVLKRAVELAKAFPDKDFRLGLPAYYDRGRALHPLNVENTSVALTGLRALLPELGETLCAPRVRILYYAYGTLTREDFLNVRAFNQLLKERCAPGRPKGNAVVPLR
jgi:hypothetical protein